MAPLLKLTDVRTFYGHIEALKGVTLQVHAGEIVTLIGANGAGKTTTLMTISGIHQARYGTIEYAGRPIERMSADDIVKAGIAHCPEGRRIFPQLTVMENLRLGAFTRKGRPHVEEDLGRILDMFPVLAERRSQFAGTLSGGQQQMLAIGRSLMSRPKLLLLDEPSLGLAPLMVEKIFAVIRDIRTQGTTILLVEQNARLALTLADRGYVLETGRVVLADEASALLSNDIVRAAYLGE